MIDHVILLAMIVARLALIVVVRLNFWIVRLFFIVAWCMWCPHLWLKSS